MISREGAERAKMEKTKACRAKLGISFIRIRVFLGDLCGLARGINTGRSNSECQI